MIAAAAALQRGQALHAPTTAYSGSAGRPQVGYQEESSPVKATSVTIAIPQQLPTRSKRNKTRACFSVQRNAVVISNQVQRRRKKTRACFSPWPTPAKACALRVPSPCRLERATLLRYVFVLVIVTRGHIWYIPGFPRPIYRYLRRL